MKTRSRIRLAFAARDPARARLAVATAVSLGVLVGAQLSELVIGRLGADHSILAVALFLSVQAASVIKDHSARARFVTSVLLIPAVVLACVLASVLLPNRVAVVAIFVAISGIAIWVRRFGERAAALGAIAFMGYFFALVMKPSDDGLFAFCLVAAVAVASQAAFRLLLLVKRPRREIGVLLMELRMASNAALDVAVRPGQSALLHTRLARIDTICTAIESWQENYPTELHIAVDAETLDGLVLNARVTTEECCYELSRCANSATMEHTRLEAAISRFHAVLAEPRIRKKAAAEKMAAAKLTATAVPVRADHPLTEKSDLDFAEYLIGCGIDAQLRLREIDLTRGLIAPARKAAPARESNRTGLIAAGVRSTPQPDQRAAPVSAPNKPFWTPWRAWAPTSRMAVQTMIAAIIASGVGELISASHWYWAVMTAFVVFIGATSRSGILTRALRRVTGTVLGIAVGIALVALAAGSTNALVAICVLAVFGMLYFGPLNYAHSAFFLTVMLVAMYRLLGVLNANLVELRIEETLAGAVIGVICAYGILSTSSKPLLVGKLDDYFSALEDALQSLAVALPRTARNRKLRASLHALETAQGELDQTVSGMVTAFVVSGVRRETRAVNLMHIVTGSLARLVQLDSVHSLTPTAEAIATVAASAQQARHILGTFQARDGSPGGAQRLLSRESLAVRSRSGDPIGPRSSYDEALVALGRMQWALEQVSIVWLRN